MNFSSPWKAVVVADNGTDSAEVDLGGIYQKLVVLIPTITSSTVTIHVTDKPGGSYFPAYTLKQETTGDRAQITTGATTTHMVVFGIGGVQHIKVICGSTQSGAKTFYVRGVNP